MISEKISYHAQLVPADESVEVAGLIVMADGTLPASRLDDPPTLAVGAVLGKLGRVLPDLGKVAYRRYR